MQSGGERWRGGGAAWLQRGIAVVGYRHGDPRCALFTSAFTCSIDLIFAFSSASVVKTRWHAKATASAICRATFFDLQPKAYTLRTGSEHRQRAASRAR